MFLFVCKRERLCVCVIALCVCVMMVCMCVCYDGVCEPLQLADAVNEALWAGGALCTD